MKAYLSGDVTPFVFNLDEWPASHTSFLPPWGKSPWYPFNGRMVGPQNWPGLLGTELWFLSVWPVVYSVFHEQTFKNLYIILKLVSLVIDILQRLNNSLSTRRILSCVSTRGSCEASAIHGRQYLHAMDLGKVYWMWPNPLLLHCYWSWFQYKRWSYPCPLVPCHEWVQRGIQMNPTCCFH